MSDRAPRRTGAPAKGSRALKPKVAAPVPTDPVELLDQPVGLSGFAAAHVLRRSGRRLGVDTVRDLLFHLPRRYDDLREMRTLDDLHAAPDGAVVSARVRVTDLRVQQSFRRRVQVTTAFLADETGTAEATWFGRRFIERRMRPGDELIVSGKLKHRGFGIVFDDPEFQKADADNLLHVGRIVPVYRLTSGLTAARLRQAMREALDKAGYAYPEYLPPELRTEEAVPPIAEALEHAHYPTTFDDRDAALRRLAFDELLALQLGMVARRRARGRARTTAVVADDGAGRRDPRGARGVARPQARARGGRSRRTRRSRSTRSGATSRGRCRCSASSRATSARARPRSRRGRSPRPRSRGGRGRCSRRPTSSPASTRRPSATSCEDLAVPVTLLTGSLTGDSRKKALEAIATGQAGIVVGTHALFQEAVAFADLALAVVDEQHRFGVEQRGALEAKATRGVPHVLLMTATPIPRTLGQVIYADLDVSTLRSAPAGRVPIRTGIRRPAELEGTWDKVREEAAAGRRTFVVVPRIGPAAPKDADGAADGDGFFDDDELLDEDVETAWAAAAEAEYERLGTLLAPLRVGLVHGRLKPADRDGEMARFRDGDLDVLVGTTVVEVGVDVTDATMMVIEGAERFGLAQLHQLRGRVGRGTRPQLLRARVRGGGGDDRARAAQGGRVHDRRLRARRTRLRAAARGRRPRASPRAACRACASRRSPTPRTASWRPAPASTRSGSSARTARRPPIPRLSASSPAAGCARVFAGDPASAA